MPTFIGQLPDQKVEADLSTGVAVFNTRASEADGVVIQDSLDISEAAAAVVVLGFEALKVIRLHEIFVNMKAQGTIAIEYSDDALGATNPVVLSGPYSFGAGAGLPMRFVKDPAGCLKAPAGKYMILRFGVSGGGGHAIVSKGDA